MANQVFPNKVIESKIEDMYSTKVRMNDYITVNDELQRNAGDTIKVNLYNATGNVQDLSMGQGNSSDVESTLVSNEYTVGVTQGRAAYYDEEFNQDPKVVDVLIEGLAAKMSNDHTAKVIAEVQKSPTWSIADTLGFDAFADAVAIFGETEAKIFAFINPKDLATLRKALKEDLKYVEAFSRTGYIGTVCGCDVIMSNAISQGEIEIFTREAVTLFNKRGFEVEQERDANLRKNTIYNRKTCVVALTDAAKAIRLFFGLTALITNDAPAFTTASATAGSTVLHVPTAPVGYEWQYKAGSSAASVTFGTAFAGGTAVTGNEATVAMSTNTHLTAVLVKSSDKKPVAYKDLTGDDLKIGA